ncbi:hypothetical protein N7474_007215 [Penicillium riverlandense]|uniref:uncharacterized protein n=1 Tax=Penicillium riverlandense TaxID=1903569 RepID=UPI002549AA5C|nr:uncharacterized protein N7474_007215 [Penicillium riverlandense]KAJ5815438.1 hypothetical protein N7474_007215 [Penicillium riverlandense]
MATVTDEKVSLPDLSGPTMMETSVTLWELLLSWTEICMDMGIKAHDLAKLCCPQPENDLITAVDAHKYIEAVMFTIAEDKALVEAWQKKLADLKAKAEETSQPALALAAGADSASAAVDKDTLSAPAPAGAGLADPATFMAKWRTLATQLAPVVTTTTPVVVFKNLPDWACVSDVLSLVHGGVVDRVSIENGEAVVIFTDAEACKKYAGLHDKGIRVGGDGEHIVAVELSDLSDAIDAEHEEAIKAGATRVVRAVPVLQTLTFAQLQAVSLQDAYKLEHLSYLAAANGAGVARFYFCSIADSIKFAASIKDSQDWKECDVEFDTDPCQVATAFHSNAPSARMASAIAVTDQQ